MVEAVRSVSWDADLQEYLESKRDADEPCAYFASGAVQAMTGTDLVASFRGRLTWARENLVAALDEVLERRGVSFARNGDLIMKDGNLGVCHGIGSMFMAMHEGQTGLTVVPTLDCDKAWTVG